MNARHTSTTGPCRDTWESDSIVGTKTVGEGIRPRTQHQNPRQLSPPNPTDKPLTLIPRPDQFPHTQPVPRSTFHVQNTHNKLTLTPTSWSGTPRLRLMKVLAAMSGGVDSAVAAARAVEAGHEVVGVHLALSRMPGTLRTGGRGCCTIEDSMDAQRAANVIGIPYYVWDFSERFKADIVD